MTTLSIRVPRELEERLAREARLRGRGRSDVARDALNRFLDESERDRFMNSLVEEARTLHADAHARREMIDVAEEFLPVENEALEVAEGPSDEEPWWE